MLQTVNHRNTTRASQGERASILPDQTPAAEFLLPPLSIYVGIQDARQVSADDRAVRPGMRALEMEILGAGDEAPEALAQEINATRASIRQELEQAQADAWNSPAVAKVRRLTEGLEKANRQLSEVRIVASAAKRKVLAALRSGAAPDSAEKEYLEFQDETRRLELRIKELPALIAEARTDAIQAVKAAVTCRASELLAEFKEEKARWAEIFVRQIREQAPRIALADVGIFMLDFQERFIRSGHQNDLRESLARLPADLTN